MSISADHRPNGRQLLGLLSATFLKKSLILNFVNSFFYLVFRKIIVYICCLVHWHICQWANIITAHTHNTYNTTLTAHANVHANAWYLNTHVKIYLSNFKWVQVHLVGNFFFYSFGLCFPKIMIPTIDRNKDNLILRKTKTM